MKTHADQLHLFNLKEAFKLFFEHNREARVSRGNYDSLFEGIQCSYDRYFDRIKDGLSLVEENYDVEASAAFWNQELASISFTSKLLKKFVLDKRNIDKIRVVTARQEEKCDESLDDEALDFLLPKSLKDLVQLVSQKTEQIKKLI
jgi:hypothetical protein